MAAKYRAKGYTNVTALKGGIKGFVGNDPYYGDCVITVIKGRIVGILGNPGDAASLIKSIERGI